MFLRHGNFDVSQLRKLYKILEEQGNRKSYAIMIIKAIDDVDSEEKARCLANLTQSVINSQISKENYLRLVHLLKQIIKADLKYLAENICKGTIIEKDYIDDYIVVGIIREADGDMGILKKHGI